LCSTSTTLAFHHSPEIILKHLCNLKFCSYRSSEIWEKTHERKKYQAELGVLGRL